jgi:hypothetical protein
MEKLMESLLDTGIQNLINFGDLVPVAFVYNRKGENFIWMMDFSNKDLAIKNLRKVCKEFKAVKVIIMAEAFYSSDLSGVRPSLAPDREESIIIQGEDINGKSSAIIQPFYRDENGNIKFKNKIKQLQLSPLGRWGKILSS